MTLGLGLKIWANIISRTKKLYQSKPYCVLILFSVRVQLASSPAGLSITEMEIRQFQALFPDSVNQRMFCYFRDPNITKYEVNESIYSHIITTSSSSSLYS